GILRSFVSFLNWNSATIGGLNRSTRSLPSSPAEVNLTTLGACRGVGFGRLPVDGDVGIAFVAFLERHLRFQYCRLRTGGGGRLFTDKVGKFATVCECEFADRRKRTCPGIACRNRWAMGRVDGW